MTEDRGRPSTSNAGGSDGADELAAAFSRFARDVERQDPAAVLDEVVRAAIVLIPGCDEASVSLFQDHRRVTSHAASGDLPRAVDALQESLGEGPCLDAAYERETVRVSDLAAEPRWPRFTAAAREAGAAGMLAFQLYVEKDDLGALNLYSRVPGAFDDESEHVGLMFAAHASLAYAASRAAAAAVRKVATSQLIGQAEGILMERHKVTDHEAFSMLVRESQHRNIKLRDIADRLVRSGQIGGPARDASS